MTAPGTKRLKLEYDELLSSFAFNLDLRRYNLVLRVGVFNYLDRDLAVVVELAEAPADYDVVSPGGRTMTVDVAAKGTGTAVFTVRPKRLGDVAIQVSGRGLHSSTFQLNLSRFCHTSPCPPV